MKPIYKSASFLVGVLVAGAVSAQVTFTNQSVQLQSISGFSNEDCAVDMNQDGLDDIVRVTNSGIYIDYQQAGGGFTPFYQSMPITNPPNWSICAGDIDGNGFTDLVFGNGSRVSFCMANADGSAFTEDARPEYIFSQRSTMADIDNDGHLDAFVCHDVDQSHPYRNDGNGYLVLDQSLITTLDVGGNYAAIWCDYDNDWDSDLYITKCRGGAPVGDPQRVNLLYRNNGNGTFTEVGAETNMNDGDQSWTTVFEDFDNDGDFDSFTVNHSVANRFMRNNGNGTFTDIIGTTGINASDLGAWNCDAYDFDNNGYVDIFSEMSTELYLNNGDGTFTAQNLNFDSGGVADLNNDGFLDVINGSTLWVNDGNDNNYVKFSLEGLVSNKNAIGARVEIYGDFGVQIREVRSGRSFAPMSSMIVHFGLGQSTAIDQVIIKWPSGTITQLDAPEINTTHEIPEVGCLMDPNTITVNGGLSICPGTTTTLVADPGFSYTWSNGATTQSIDVADGGNYSVILWDNECASISNTVSVTVVTEESPSITLETADVICQGSEAILSASIGSGYAWSNGADTQTIAVTESGAYYVTIDALCENIELISETIEITVLDAAAAPTATDVMLDTPGAAILNATGDNLVWYDAEDDIDPVGTGNSFTTDFVNSSLTYWVEANTIHGGALEDGGKVDNSGGGGLPSSGAYTYFNAFEPFTIQSVLVYVPEGGAAGNRTVELYDGNGVLLQSATFDLMIGETVIDLNFDVPVGNGFSLRCPENNLFRNNAGVQYPYAIGTVGEMYDSFFGASYYYYFYDWKIQKEEMICPSPRVPVTAMVVGIDEIEGLSELNVFPNPANTEVTLSFNLDRAAKANVYVQDVTGKLVMSRNVKAGVDGNRVSLDVSALAPGMYEMVLEVEGARTSRKIVVE
ncbi:MAG: T9SS type A sorting domain-containing protein [Cryomorphaceae bacterium]|nr:T9SS type A sorting domain-containing protein [Cryomorphaceae bacterium]